MKQKHAVGRPPVSNSERRKFSINLNFSMKELKKIHAAMFQYDQYGFSGSVNDFVRFLLGMERRKNKKIK